MKISAQSFYSLILIFCIMTHFSGIALAGDFEDAQAAYNRQDFHTALQLWLPLAEAGNADAQYNLGIIYDNGYGIKRDYKQAVDWFRRSAIQGNAAAQRHYRADVLTLQLDMPMVAQAKDSDNIAAAAPVETPVNAPDIEPAAGNSRKAQAQPAPVRKKSTVPDIGALAEQGNAEAQTKIGAIYATGDGVPQDYELAEKWFRLAAEQGYAKAQAALGVLYSSGAGVTQDYTEAAKWYKKAAEQGNARAQKELAALYAQNLANPNADEYPDPLFSIANAVYSSIASKVSSMKAEIQKGAPPAETTPEAETVPEAETIPEAEALPGQPNLSSHEGLEVGVQASKYEYHEVVGGAPFMNNKGYKLGIEGGYTHLFGDNMFVRGDGRFAYGPVDYSGSGYAKGNPDETWEIRLLVGEDIPMKNYGLSPYSGYGTRFLYNDARGLSSTGAAGYRRKSLYEYVPFGVTHRVELSNQARIATNLEYDYFIHGTQKSFLGDALPGKITLKNTQGKAVGGARGSVLLESAGWSMGPWFNYWHIRDSSTNCIPGICGLEPDNTTMEFGVKLVKKIW